MTSQPSPLLDHQHQYIYNVLKLAIQERGGVGMAFTGSLMFVYICIDVGDPVEGRGGMPLTGSLMFVYICIDVGDPVEGRCCDAINK
jgi:hypothetical protein